MKMEWWYLTLGALLVVIALVASRVQRLPLTTTMLYVGVGILLGPLVFDVGSIDPLENAGLLERLAELAVIVSLFTAGLKLRGPFRSAHWKVPARLAFLSMSLTVAMVTLVGVFGLGLPLGAAVLLGAVLAPTDPVLASDVQLESASDRDKLRFSLTGEAGLNDGTAFPFVMLGLGLLGLHEMGPGGWRWFAVDVLWAIPGGLAIGALCGVAVARLVLYLRRTHREGIGRDEFLALGLIGLSYGTALMAHTYGFLAVFAAGLAFRLGERTPGDATRASAEKKSALETENLATDPETAPAHMAAAVLNFNEQFERILEVGLVLVLGMMLAPEFLHFSDLWFVAVLLLVIRPIAVYLGLLAANVPRNQLALMSWFGIRGIGSIYYLMYALGFGVAPSIARQLISVTLWVIVVSVILHGISVTPLMNWYGARRKQTRGTC
jgi:NhaP-type Na+/H+ or K+/H+ antiporter